MQTAARGAAAGGENVAVKVSLTSRTSHLAANFPRPGPFSQPPGCRGNARVIVGGSYRRSVEAIRWRLPPVGDPAAWEECADCSASMRAAAGECAEAAGGLPSLGKV